MTENNNIPPVTISKAGFKIFLIVLQKYDTHNNTSVLCTCILNHGDVNFRSINLFIINFLRIALVFRSYRTEVLAWLEIYFLHYLIVKTPMRGSKIKNNVTLEKFLQNCVQFFSQILKIIYRDTIIRIN